MRKAEEKEVRRKRNKMRKSRIEKWGGITDKEKRAKEEKREKEKKGKRGKG